MLSPLDSYVCGRMTTLAAPCSALMDAEPLTVRGNDLLEDVTEHDQGRALPGGGRRRPPRPPDRPGHALRPRQPAPREVLLVDHAEQAQSVAGIEKAHIVEILDHHHIGSIETRVPVRATFDPVGSTSTLVIERFRQAGEEPTPPTATVLLGAILSDTVILNSPTTTERDHAAVALPRARSSASTPRELRPRDVRERLRRRRRLGRSLLVSRDPKEYETGEGPMSIAQVETAGRSWPTASASCATALQAQHDRNGHVLSALMVTDILEKRTQLLVAGDVAAAERAFGSDGRRTASSTCRA